MDATIWFLDKKDKSAGKKLCLLDKTIGQVGFDISF